MKLSNALVIAVMTTTALYGVRVGAQSANGLPAQNFYYDNSAWPLPEENKPTALRLAGMNSVHAVMMTFSHYEGGKPVTGSPIITLLEGSTANWNPPGGCSYELQLVNENPPVINMRKTSFFCALLPGAKVIFKILALP
jgi:hypothetical protein